jgi:hypothetical protein
VPPTRVSLPKFDTRLFDWNFGLSSKVSIFYLNLYVGMQRSPNLGLIFESQGFDSDRKSYSRMVCVRRYQNRSLSDRIFNRVVRQTGKYWWFTVLSYAISISGIFLIVLWDDRTAEYHFWLDAALTGLGGSSVTTTVITVSPLLPLVSAELSSDLQFWKALVSSVAKEDIAVAMGS